MSVIEQIKVKYRIISEPGISVSYDTLIDNSKSANRSYDRLREWYNKNLSSREELLQLYKTNVLDIINRVSQYQGVLEQIETENEDIYTFKINIAKDYRIISEKLKLISDDIDKKEIVGKIEQLYEENMDTLSKIYKTLLEKICIIIATDYNTNITEFMNSFSQIGNKVESILSENIVSRNELNELKISLELYYDSQVPDKIKYIEKIKSEITNLRTLFTNFKDFEQFTSGFINGCDVHIETLSRYSNLSKNLIIKLKAKLQTY